MAVKPIDSYRLSTQMNTDSLPVMEDFYTIQGEGRFQGHAAYFIRLGGCEVGCVWCDVKESWDVSAHPSVLINELVDKAKAQPGNIVVVTGGEPAMHNLLPLTQEIKVAGLRTHIETSGVYQLTGLWDWITFSPKKFKAPHESIFSIANELKVVIYNKTDFEWAEGFAQKVSPKCLLYLQPEWSREKEMLPSIVEYVKQHPKWKVSLQVHKYMNIP
jgi:7-carboxy-7-deazaguanine synthase